MDFTVNLLGCGSAKPSVKHNQSCTVINHRQKLYMIDCGEGAQQQMMRMGLKFSRLRHIFITHLHGDHILGLPGLLQTLSLNGHTGTMTLHTFREGIKFIEKVRSFFGYELGYNLQYHIIEPTDGTVWEDDSIAVESIPLSHRVDCVGYVFREKEKLRHLIPEMLEYHSIPIAWRHRLKKGEDYVNPDGTILPNAIFTKAPSPSASYAHLCDTSYIQALSKKISGVTCMLHDSTYADDKTVVAEQRGHSTSRQAALLAREANVGKLILSHFSSAYRNEDILLEQAREVFPATILGKEGMKIEL